jgi:hypothetical protein
MGDEIHAALTALYHVPQRSATGRLTLFILDEYRHEPGYKLGKTRLRY